MIDLTIPKFHFSIIGACLLAILISCNTDPCEGKVCENGGRCLEGICECPDGFIGDDCETVDVSSLIGNYDGRYEGCFQTGPDHIIQLDQSPVGGFAIEFINLGDYACPSSSDGRLRVQASLSGNDIQMPEQTVCADGNFAGYLFQGSGTVFSDSIRFTFSVVYDADGNARTDNCTAILIKP